MESLIPFIREAFHKRGHCGLWGLKHKKCHSLYLLGFLAKGLGCGKFTEIFCYWPSSLFAFFFFTKLWLRPSGEKLILRYKKRTSYWSAHYKKRRHPLLFVVFKKSLNPSYFLVMSVHYSVFFWEISTIDHPQNRSQSEAHRSKVSIWLWKRISRQHL